MKENTGNEADVLMNNAPIEWEAVTFYFDRAVTRTQARWHVEKQEGRIIKKETQNDQ